MKIFFSKCQKNKHSAKDKFAECFSLTLGKHVMSSILPPSLISLPIGPFLQQDHSFSLPCSLSLILRFPTSLSRALSYHRLSPNTSIQPPPPPDGSPSSGGPSTARAGPPLPLSSPCPIGLPSPPPSNRPSHPKAGSCGKARRGGGLRHGPAWWW